MITKAIIIKLFGKEKVPNIMIIRLNSMKNTILNNKIFILKK